MPRSKTDLRRFLSSLHPYDSLQDTALHNILDQFTRMPIAKDDIIYPFGEPCKGLYVILDGDVEITSENGGIISQLGPRNSFGERGLMRDGKTGTNARALSDGELLLLPTDAFHDLIAGNADAHRFFTRGRGRETADATRPATLAETRVDQLMASDPITCARDATIRDAAKIMREHRISCLPVTDDGNLAGIITLHDINNRVVAEGLDATLPVSRVMTESPLTLPPSAIGSDVLHMMMERRFGHVPIVDQGKLVGIVTQTNLTRFQAANSASLVHGVARATTPDGMGAVTAKIPQLLVQLVGAGNRHETVTRLITDIADAVTRRLLALAEDEFGPPPVPYLWLACGSQGRQEQTGVSDQDNCLMLDDAVTDDDMPYFAKLAKFVSDGLDHAGYFYCPGDMMATNERWCQPVRVWRSYFRRWIDSPSIEAQMLASVMFDLRPIGGTTSLFEDLHRKTLEQAARNSIFVAHMVSNSLKHNPPLGLLRGFATLRSGEHKNHIDMKMNGVIPVVDLGRIYALRGQLESVNTRARIASAHGAGLISQSGGRDLLDAYDLIAQTRLDHQAKLIRAGARPDNFMSPNVLSEFERSHLRDAFVVVRTMQSAVTQGRGVIG
ncbi:MAG: cyclic nucleotide-binding/CBS domain-containing protein [Loktanella sp.]|nr:cyclic nucleotide-binding/CBS domain-containing protein [Loktanella sp.]